MAVELQYRDSVAIWNVIEEHSQTSTVIPGTGHGVVEDLGNAGSRKSSVLLIRRVGNSADPS